MQPSSLILRRAVLATKPPAVGTSCRISFRPHPGLLQGPFSNSVSLTRPLTSTPRLYKKKDKSKPAPAPAAAPEPSSSKNGALADDPYDLSRVESGIANAVSRLKDDLSKLRVGGRFNNESLESLSVQPNKESKDTVKLGDLAQVVPKGGRMTTVLAFEEEVSL